MGCLFSHLFDLNVFSYSLSYLTRDLERTGEKCTWDFPGGSSGKEPACQCRRLRDAGLIPESGQSPGGGNSNHSSILAWRIPWTDEPGRLQLGHKESDITEQLSTHTQRKMHVSVSCV